MIKQRALLGQERFFHNLPFLVDLNNFIEAKQDIHSHVSVYLQMGRLKRATIGDTGVSSRVLNNWIEKGIISLKRNNHGWHQLGLFDLVYLRIIEELRKFGLSLKQLRKVYKSLHELKDSNSRIPLLEFGSYISFYTAVDVFVLVFEDGFATIATESDIAFTKFNGMSPTFVKINLNLIVNETLKNLEFPNTPIIQPPSPSKLAELAQEGEESNLKEVRISLNPKANNTHIEKKYEFPDAVSAIKYSEEHDRCDVTTLKRNNSFVMGEVTKVIKIKDSND